MDPPPPVRTLIQRHSPWEELQNVALAIIDHTYAAALVVGGVRDATSRDVKLSRPIDPADPDSPVLTVHAAAKHCLITVKSTRGEADAFASKGSRPTHRLDLATITISPGTLHLARTGGGGTRRPRNRVNVASSRRELAIVDAIVSRLDALIGAEKELLRKALAAGCGAFPKIAEINEVSKVLQEMRREMDLEALVRRRLQKRRVVEAIAGGWRAAKTTAPAPTQAPTKKVKTLRIVDPGSRSRAEVLEQICH